RELIHDQIALFFAFALQILVLNINHELLVGPQYIIIPTEIFLAIIIGFTVNRHSVRKRGIHHALALILPALISVANISSLVLVLHSLVITHAAVTGTELLSAAIAIFITNIIVFALWYWEIDSPGLTRKRWSKNDQDFQFTQQDLKKDYPNWRPEFLDYLYLSVTNAINFAAADARPVTHAAKLHMGLQALVSVFTLALVLARSVSILG
ncbi:MAG: hypothetical protein AAB834_00700, partial [Patescibacteria group bacterium]